MDKYNVYKHPILGYEAIKQGFSWPGFFFTWVWAFVKKLYVAGIGLLIAAFIANSIGFSLSGGGTDGAFFGLIVSLIPMAIAGVKGNEWREKSMNTRGYKHECSVMAASSDGALGEAMKPANEITSRCLRCGGTGQVTAIDECYIGFECEQCEAFWGVRNKDNLSMSDVRRDS